MPRKPTRITVRLAQMEHAKGLPLPAYQTEGAAGLDLAAAIPEGETLRLKRGQVLAVRTGLMLEMPQGLEAQVRPRSGLALRNAVTVLNSPGTIDSDYRGEIQVILINHGAKTFEIRRGDRIAQLVFAPVTQAAITTASKLSTTKRGAGGFGSTGIGKSRANKAVLDKRRPRRPLRARAR